VTPPTRDTKEYVVTDVEGTLSTGEMWRGIGRYLAAHGRAWRWRLFLAVNLPEVMAARLGLIPVQTFKNRWLERQARLLRGYTAERMDHLAEWVVEHEVWPGRRETVLAELAQHHAEGRTVLLASGMYPPVLQALARRFGFEPVEVAGTALEFVDGCFTGRFAAPVCVADEKARQVRLRTEGAVVVAAYGDTGSDIPMLELSRGPVAVAPDHALETAARARGWRILAG
jgi:phosphoserine phosphatase